MHNNNDALQLAIATCLGAPSGLSLSPNAARAPCDRPHASAMQDCNLVLYKASGTAPADAIYSSGTYNKGAPPCQLTISSAGGGFIAVSDSKFAQLYTAPTPALVRRPSPLRSDVQHPAFLPEAVMPASACNESWRPLHGAGGDCLPCTACALS